MWFSTSTWMVTDLFRLLKSIAGDSRVYMLPPMRDFFSLSSSFWICSCSVVVFSTQTHPHLLSHSGVHSFLVWSMKWLIQPTSPSTQVTTLKNYWGNVLESFFIILRFFFFLIPEHFGLIEICSSFCEPSKQQKDENTSLVWHQLVLWCHYF